MPPAYSSSFDRQLPLYPSTLASTPRYPHAMGFVYVAAAFERCVYQSGCMELMELPTEEQRLISRLTDMVLEGLEVFKTVGGGTGN
jgi:hypothetical protein